MTWPGPVILFCPKLHQGCPISYAKFQRDPSSGWVVIPEENSWGCIIPPPSLHGRGLRFRCLLCAWPNSELWQLGWNKPWKGPPGRVCHLLKMKTSSFLPTLLSTGPYRLLHWKGPLESGAGHLRPEIGPCGPGMELLRHVNCLFSLNVESERL